MWHAGLCVFLIPVLLTMDSEVVRQLLLGYGKLVANHRKEVVVRCQCVCLVWNAEVAVDVVISMH